MDRTISKAVKWQRSRHARACFARGPGQPNFSPSNDPLHPKNLFAVIKGIFSVKDVKGYVQIIPNLLRNIQAECKSLCTSSSNHGGLAAAWAWLQTKDSAWCSFFGEHFRSLALHVSGFLSKNVTDFARQRVS